MVGGFDEAASAHVALEERFGAPGAFTPAPDGASPPARMEAFLAVRDAMASPRARLEATFSRLPLGKRRADEIKDLPFLERLTLGLSIGRAALDLGPVISDFLRARDEALLAQGMGMGEYAYIYSVAYYSWLGHRPSDGPDGRATEGAPEDDGRRAHMMGGSVAGRVHDECGQMLRNQLASLPRQAPAAWHEALSREIAAMAADDTRSPWQDGVPPAIAAAFEPYRARLEAGYSPVSNPLELARSRRRGRMSFSAD
jgi:hypothetical protein